MGHPLVWPNYEEYKGMFIQPDQEEPVYRIYTYYEWLFVEDDMAACEWEASTLEEAYEFIDGYMLEHQTEDDEDTDTPEYAKYTASKLLRSLAMARIEDQIRFRYRDSLPKYCAHKDDNKHWYFYMNEDEALTEFLRVNKRTGAVEFSDHACDQWVDEGWEVFGS